MNGFREPLISSLIDIGSNNIKMFNFGFSGKTSKPAGWDFKNNKWSVGGILSAPIRGGIGAGLGYMAGAMVDSPYGAVAGAAIGATTLWSAPAILGLASKKALNLSFALGDEMFNAGKNFFVGGQSNSILSNVAKGGTNMLKTASKESLLGATAFISHAPVLNGILNPSNLIKTSADASKGIAGLEFSKLGKAYIGLGIASGIANEAWQSEKQIRMGQIDPRINRATPNIPDYLNNGGATGDLVFAMHKNRRG